MRFSPQIPYLQRLAGGLLLAAGLLLTQLPGVAQDASPAKPVARAQRLAFALYRYDFQGNHRKTLPVQGLRNASGASLLRDHPWRSVGPWTSYDRADWHRTNITDLTAAGIDVMMPLYRGDAASRRTYSVRGLDMLAQALKQLRSEGAGLFADQPELPRVAITLDLDSVADVLGGSADLKTAPARETLYQMVRESYSRIPREFRATILIPPGQADRGGGAGPALANLLRLVNEQAVTGFDDAALADLRRRFRADFGAPLLVIGAPALKKSAPGLDATAPYPAAAGDPALDGGPTWPVTAALGPGWDPEGSSEIRPRENGRRLIQDVRALLEGSPDWLIIDTWNDYARASEVAPSLEYGLLYRDLLRGGILQWKQVDQFAAVILQATMPREILQNQIYQVEVTVQNAGESDWSPANIVSLGYRWWRGGKPVTQTLAPVGIEAQRVGEQRTYILGIASPLGQGEALPAGDYEIELMLTRFTAEGAVPFRHFEQHPYRLPVGVRATLPAGRPAWLASDMPLVVERGASYPVTLRLRNDGGTTWKPSEVQLVHRWRRGTDTLKSGAGEPVSDFVAAAIEDEVPPGDVARIQALVQVKDGAGQSLATWNPDGAAYHLEWNLTSAGRASPGAGSPLLEPVEVTDRDPAPFFLGASLSPQLVAGRTEQVTVGLRNLGPHEWKAGRDKVVTHWYYLDGTEAIYRDSSAPLPRDVPAFSREEVELPRRGELARQRREEERRARRRGGKPPASRREVTLDLVMRDLPVTVPPYFGPMICVFDFEYDGLLASTASGCRGRESLAVAVNVFSPTFTPLPLDGQFNVDGVSDEIAITDGNIDGRGNSFPGELLPPYVIPPPGFPDVPAPGVYPSGLWARPLNQLDGSRACFAFPPRAPGQPNMLACGGQRLVFAPAARTAVYLLAAATEEEMAGDFTLYYTDGSSSRQSLRISYWNAPPRYGEPVAFRIGHRHTAAGDDPATPCYLFEYRLQVDQLKQLVAVELPRRAEIKIMAITLASGGAAGQSAEGGGPSSAAAVKVTGDKTGLNSTLSKSR